MLDERGTYAYAGCLEGRGFDELGAKGFVLLNVEDKIEARFVPFGARSISEVTVDLSECEDFYTAQEKVRAQIDIESKDILRLILTGELSFDQSSLAEDIQTSLADRYYFVSVKDRTVRRYDPREYEDNLSLRGEFIRIVLADESLSEEEKSAVIALGIRALDGREVEV